MLAKACMHEISSYDISALAAFGFGSSYAQPTSHGESEGGKVLLARVIRIQIY